MANTSLAETIRNPETRLGRAVRLFEERGAEIQRIAPETYLVPSSDGKHTYRVDYRNETCNCEDANFHPNETCKHVLMLGIALAKRRRPLRCAACNAETPRRALREVFEDTATVRAGERVCGPCGRSHEVPA